mmetsp:Transcript_8765/g.18507  ORF Transcript_8765/g.18507 Transcript_8765/m.18507 type:complete len:353 (-) Transcript_8765:1596-2654(-)
MTPWRRIACSTRRQHPLCCRLGRGDFRRTCATLSCCMLPRRPRGGTVDVRDGIGGGSCARRLQRSCCRTTSTCKSTGASTSVGAGVPSSSRALPVVTPCAASSPPSASRPLSGEPSSGTTTSALSLPQLRYSVHSAVAEPATTCGSSRRSKGTSESSVRTMRSSSRKWQALRRCSQRRRRTTRPRRSTSRRLRRKKRRLPAWRNVSPSSRRIWRRKRRMPRSWRKTWRSRRRRPRSASWKCRNCRSRRQRGSTMSHPHLLQLGSRRRVPSMPQGLVPSQLLVMRRLPPHAALQSPLSKLCSRGRKMLLLPLQLRLLTFLAWSLSLEALILPSLPRSVPLLPNWRRSLNQRGR